MNYLKAYPYRCMICGKTPMDSLLSIKKEYSLCMDCKKKAPKTGEGDVDWQKMSAELTARGF